MVVILFHVRCIVKDSMSYIGQGLPSNSFIGYTTDTFAGDGSTTAFTMSKAPFNESAVIVVINNVVQQPTADFTISGTTLTLDSAATDGHVIYATHTGGALPIDQASSLTSNIAITTTGASNFNGGVTMGGTTPTLTIGDAGAEDTKVVFDGNAQDFYIGLDDSADDLIIGLGSAVGTTPIISVDENKLTTVANGLTLTDGDVTVASGHGISFAATANTSATNASADGELLDDYEEGTWEPTMADQHDTAFTVASNSIGKYTKIGKQVTCSFYIETTSINSASGGFIKLEGLPFVHENVSYTYGTLSSNFGGGLAITAGTAVTGYVNTNQSYVIMTNWDIAAGSSSMQPGEWSDNGSLGGTIVYMTSA